MPTWCFSAVPGKLQYQIHGDANDANYAQLREHIETLLEEEGIAHIEENNAPLCHLSILLKRHGEEESGLVASSGRC